MSNGVNVCHLLGRLGRDPEVRYTQGGMAVAKFSLATDSTRKNKDGERVTETQWHNVTAFGRVAEIAGEYLKKGDQAYIIGMIRYSQSEKDGVTRYYTDIAVSELRLLGGKREEADKPARAQRREPAPTGREKPADNYSDFADDDIPF